MYEWIRQQARWSESCVLIGYPSRRDGLVLPAQNFPRWSRKEKVLVFGHIINSLLTKREVKTARYCPRTYALPMSSRLDRPSLVNVNNTYSWFATTWQGGHVGGRYNRIYMKIELSSQRRETLPTTWPPWRHVQTRNILPGPSPLFVSLRKEKLQSLANFSSFNFRLPRPLKKRAELRWSFWECWQGKAWKGSLFKKCLDCLYK